MSVSNIKEVFVALAHKLRENNTSTDDAGLFVKKICAPVLERDGTRVKLREGLSSPTDSPQIYFDGELIAELGPDGEVVLNGENFARDTLYTLYEKSENTAGFFRNAL